MGTTPTNVAEHLRFEIGDPDKAMDAADVVVEREFRTATVHQGYMEPHAATAEWSPEGTLTIWATTRAASRCATGCTSCSTFPWPISA